MAHHFLNVNKVWNQAGIRIDPVTMQRVTVREELLHGLIHKRGRGGISNFFRSIRHGDTNLKVNDKAVMWAFFVPNLGGPNGLRPLGINSIFVADNTTNKAYRVTSHEIGHVLGLHHTQHSPGQLLYPGSNGLTLDNTEQIVARYNAQRLLPEGSTTRQQ